MAKSWKTKVKADYKGRYEEIGRHTATGYNVPWSTMWDFKQKLMDNPVEAIKGPITAAACAKVRDNARDNARNKAQTATYVELYGKGGGKVVKMDPRPKVKKAGIRIAMMPDAQVKGSVNTDHLEAFGHYCAAKKPDVIVCIGDFADMPSLSQWDKVGSLKVENSRYADDIASAKAAMTRFMKPIKQAMKKSKWKPRFVMTLGNHEDRISRAIDDNPRHFEGVIGLKDLCYEDWGWEVYPFLQMTEIAGIQFCHYFVNPTSLKKNVIGGQIELKLKNLGFSFVMGHQQLYQAGHLFRSDGTHIQGLVHGAFYSHNEGYMGIQGNASHCRGAVMLNDAKDGNYDIMPLSLDYLLREWML